MRHARGTYRVVLTTAVIALTAAMLVAPDRPAQAAPPTNDGRANAADVFPPRNLTGTLVDATLEADEPRSRCGAIDGSVWYRFKAPEDGDVVLRVQAAGRLDATVDFFERVRSRFAFGGCEFTDRNGVATLDVFHLERGGEYFLRVGRETGSASDTFDLTVAPLTPPPNPPGKRLPGGGAKDSVNRLTNRSDAYSFHLQAGRAMRVSLRSSTCLSGEIYGRGTKSYDDESPEARLGCDGYRVFTAQRAGTYSILVSAAREDGRQDYRLKVAPAGRDDTLPGVFFRNRDTVRGRVNGRLDFTDLFRFDVTNRSRLSLRLNGPPDMVVTRSGGRVLARGTDVLDANVKPGRYFVSVQGDGRYTLKRVSRTITRTNVSFDGKRRAFIDPSGTARLAVTVRPGASGKAVVTVERRDPVYGWQFSRRYRMPVSGGVGSVMFDPPSIGRYRAIAHFKGTRIAAGSESGIARLRVFDPLQD